MLDDLVSEAVEDEATVLPCTLAMEDPLQNSAVLSKAEQVSSTLVTNAMLLHPRVQT